MRVLFVSPVKFRSMAGARFNRLARHLLTRDVEVHWVEPPVAGKLEGEAVNPLPESPNLRLYDTPVARGGLIRRTLRREWFQLQAVKAAVRESAPQVAVVFDGGGNVLLRSWLKHRRIPLVMDYPDRVDLFLPNRAARWLHRKMVHHAMRQAIGVTCTAHDLLAEAQRFNPNCRLVPNGADLLPTERPHPEVAENGRVKVGYVGALQDWLDLEPLFDLAARDPQVELILAGAGNLVPWVEALAQIHENVNYLGLLPANRIPETIKGFHLGIIPFAVNDLSHAVCPLKLFEYWQQAVPVIGAPTREIRTIGNTFTYNHAEELVQLVNKFRSQPEEFLDSARQGRQKVEEFYNWQTLGDLFLETIQAWLNA